MEKYGMMEMKGMVRRILAWMAVMGIMLTLLPMGITAVADTTQSIAASDVLVHGRTYRKNNILYLDWGHSGISFRFTGTGAKVTMTSSNTSDTMCGFVNVYVDGDLVPTTVLKVNQASATYTLAEGLADGTHTITIRKRNEAVYGGSATIGLVDLTVVGGSMLTPPAMSDRRIEVIGDSITAGHGNMSGGSGVGFNNTVSDATASYAGLTAQALGAEMDILARSGIRFVRAPGGDSMYPIYTQVVGLGSKATDAYDFANNEKDVIIINLGTNDNGAQVDGAPATDAYVQSEAKAFLELIRQNNPNAEIIWAYGIMGSNRSSAIKAAIAELNAAGDNKISYFALDAINSEKEGLGSGNHPTVTTAVNRSMDLAEYIAQRTGWDYDFDTQLAWQMRLAEEYTDGYLLNYTADSADALQEAIDAAQNLPNSASNADIKAAIDGVQNAYGDLQLAMTEVATITEDETSKTGHYMEFSFNTNLDLSEFEGRNLYLTYDIRADITHTPANDKWRSYVRNGQAYATDSDGTEASFASGLSLMGSSKANVDKEWCPHTIAMPLNKVATKTLNKIRLYYYNDTGGMTEEEKAGVAWDSGSGVTLRIKNVRIMVGTPRFHNEGLVYSVNALDFGADATGAADSTTAIQNAINSVKDAGGIVYLPQGRYKVSTKLEIPGGVTLRGDWQNPDDGGLGKGTILMAYYGKGEYNAENPANNAFITLRSGGCLKNISVWYPEQDAQNPSSYPITIWADGHTDVINVTLYNSYYGFYNNSCSSMLIRGLYGTSLYRGIHGAYAYDIPRIERVKFDTAYWANSGLPNAPTGDALSALNTYTQNNLIAIQAGEQDWGYWYDLTVNHAKYALFLTAVLDNEKTKLVPGNIAAGKLTATNVQVGVYMENVGYPGFQLTDSHITAMQYGMYYAPKPAIYEEYLAQGLRVDYPDTATIVVTNTTFTGGSYSFRSDKVGGYGINFNDCTFQNWANNAIMLNDGNLVCSNSAFEKNATPIKLNADVSEAVLMGNSFAYTDTAWSNDTRVVRDDASTAIPHTPDYSYDYVSGGGVASQQVFNVLDYGAVSGTYSAVPSVDSTSAFQAALNAAKAAGGGMVFVPGGVYRLNGSLTVPTGVELRGTFESAHYGNSTNNGSHLYVYGNKGNADGAPLITLEQSSGVKGFSVFYPEQGYTDTTTEEGKAVHAYPPTVRANANCWIQNMSMVCTYTAIDAMTNRCDNIIITDVTGAAMYATLIMGHGTNGGYIQNLHFNYSGWTHQGIYYNRPSNNEASTLFNNYTTSKVLGLVLGDCKNVQFLSCFNILVADQIVLEKDPYTGGSFKGTMWGVAFDAAGNGIVAKDGCDANLNIIASMGVFNQQGGGYNVVTKPGFTGHVGLYNADAWGGNSNLAYVEGGTVDLVQYFSWSAYRGYCGDGGTLNLYASTIVHDSGYVPHVVYDEGAKGEVVGNVSGAEKLNINVWPGADVVTTGNGKEITIPADTGLNFSGAYNTYTADNSSSTGNVLSTNWITRDNGNITSGVNLLNRKDSLLLKLRVKLEKSGTTASDANLFYGGRIQLRSVDVDGSEGMAYWQIRDLNLKTGENVLYIRLSDITDASMDWYRVNRFRMYIDSVNTQNGVFKMTITEARVVDETSINQKKQALKTVMNKAFDWNSGDYTDEEKAQYESIIKRAEILYNDPDATMADVNTITNELDEMQSVLLSPADKEALRLAVQDELRNPPTLSLYTTSSANAYRDALQNAHSVLVDTEAGQGAVDGALSALQDAKSALQVVDRYTVFELPTFRNVTNGQGDGVARRFYHNWHGLGQKYDLTVYDPDALVLRMNLWIGLNDSASTTILPETLTVSGIRWAVRSNQNQQQETSLYDTSVFGGLKWGDNTIEIPFSALKDRDSGTTDWSRIDDIFLYYDVTELNDAVAGDYISKITHLRLVNKDIETTIGDVGVVGNGKIDITGEYIYGGDDVISASTTAENTTFVGWWHNNTFVQEETLSCVATGNENVTAYFVKPNESVVVFYGKYNRVIDVQVVTSADELNPPTIPALEGYISKGWNEPEEMWGALLIPGGVSSLTTVYAPDAASDRYTITLVNAHRSNGTATTGLNFDTRIEVTADVPAGKVLAYWMLDGMNVGGGNSYVFYVSGNNTIQAVFADEGAPVVKPSLHAAVKQTKLQQTAEDRYTMSFICQTYLPDDYTLLEYGALIAPTYGVLRSVADGKQVDDGLTEGSDYLRIISSSRTPNRQYLVELRNVKAGRTRYGMAYIIARNADGEVVTVYSSIREVATETSNEGIGSGDTATDPFG